MLDAAGFDLQHAFDAHAVAATFRWLAGPRCGVLIGNTRALWPPFTAALADPALAAMRDPLDTYTERTIAAAYPGAPTLFAHRRYDGQFLPFQQLAVAVGLAALAPSHLLIHPVHGPWFALRAVVLLDRDPPPVAQPIARSCACNDRCRMALDAAVAADDDWRAWLAVRDACTLRASRYSEEQIAFHYIGAWESRLRSPV